MASSANAVSSSATSSKKKQQRSAGYIDRTGRIAFHEEEPQRTGENSEIAQIICSLCPGQVFSISESSRSRPDLRGDVLAVINDRFERGCHDLDPDAVLKEFLGTHRDFSKRWK